MVENSISESFECPKTFEEAMSELELTIRRLEEGKLSLEEAISNFERGMTLKKFCEEKLLAAQMRVDKIQSMQNGTPTLVPLSA